MNGASRQKPDPRSLQQEKLSWSKLAIILSRSAELQTRTGVILRKDTGDTLGTAFVHE